MLLNLNWISQKRVFVRKFCSFQEYRIKFDLKLCLLNGNSLRM
jgi:hypothetical protein